ncbi:MAG: hypothetical protein UX62_C0012G0010 [Microgenomates group bacterium GW2011_GWA2_46_7]|nr:MAG: hypothetical protein UX62_C0012G0010 [Microgenomates group bacterium GW2011_GWA2_46_7]
MHGENCLFLHKQDWGKKLQMVYASPDGSGGWSTISETTIKMDRGTDESRAQQLQGFLRDNGLGEHLSVVGDKLREMGMVK